jgi:hypothetical protein
MLYREIIAVCSEIHTKHINTLCGQNVELLNDKPDGTYSDHWVLKGYVVVLDFLVPRVSRCLQPSICGKKAGRYVIRGNTWSAAVYLSEPIDSQQVSISS